MEFHSAESRLKFKQAQPLLAALDRNHALLPLYGTRFWRAELGMRLSDSLREAAAVVSTPASAPCMILQCGTRYGRVAVWPCGCVFGGGMNNAITSKTTCKTFLIEFFDWRIPWKKSSFPTGSASRNSQSKKVEPKTPFFDCIRQVDLGVSRKGCFRLTNPTV